MTNATQTEDEEWKHIQEETFKGRATQYDRLDWVRKKDFVNFMMDRCNLQPTDRVMDIGSGTGVIAAAVRPSVAHVTGINISPEMVKLAQEKYGADMGITFKVGDVENLEEPADSFDKVTARMVFHHVNHCNRSLQGIRRVLTKGGLCVVCEGVPPDHLCRERYEKIFALKEKRRTFSEADLINIFDRAGFINITLHSFFMRQVSLNNWLGNANLPDHIIGEIRHLHTEADDHFKDIYNLEERDGDVFMDWRFICITGEKG